jgi:hypothetical protein
MLHVQAPPGREIRVRPGRIRLRVDLAQAEHPLSGARLQRRSKGQRFGRGEIFQLKLQRDSHICFLEVLDEKLGAAIHFFGGDFDELLLGSRGAEGDEAKRYDARYYTREFVHIPDAELRSETLDSVVEGKHG